MFQYDSIDSFSGVPSGETVAADTLSAVSAVITAGDPVAGPAPATDIFGTLSESAIYHAGTSSYFDWILTGNIPYSLAVLVCLAGFCLLVWYFRPHMATVAGIFRGTLYIEKVMQEHNYIFETFRRLLILSGLLVAGLVIVRYGDYMWGDRIAASIPRWAISLPVPAVWVGLLGVWFFQGFLLRTAGWLTYGTRFTSHLISLRNLGYSLVFLFSIPVMLAVTLAGEGALPALWWVAAIPVAGLLIFVLIRIYMLFIRQKISILYWILYLCAVEILPVSFLVVLAVRSMQQ